jgi:hypothetical protein
LRSSSPVEVEDGDSITEEGDDRDRDVEGEEEGDKEDEEEEEKKEKGNLNSNDICASMFYFVAPSDSQPRGSITIRNSTKLSARLLGNSLYDKERSGGKENCFTIRNKGHGYYFIADNREDAMMWINAIKDL